MLAARLAAFAAALVACVFQFACHTPGDRIMTYPAYRGVEHTTPYVLDVEKGDSRLVYFGASHLHEPGNAEAADIERRWEALRPDFALNEGGDPPAEATRELAVGRHAEAGLLRWLAHRDGVPIQSLDPTREREVEALRDRFSPEELKTFYVLRRVMQDAQRAPEFRQASPDALVERSLEGLRRVPGLEGSPRTLGEFEQACRRYAPQLTDWRKVPAEWFDPAPDSPAAFTNTIARAMSEFRDRFIVDVLEGALREHKRVFAAIGASHVVMQEPELRIRFDRVKGPAGLMEPNTSAESTQPRVVSLLGKELVPPPMPEARREELARKLADYSERVASPSAAEEDYIWLGRTLGYLHRYHDAIDAFSRGLEKFPQSHRLLRHRGHRFITIRDLVGSKVDLERAVALIEQNNIPDEIEPDGAPNRSGVPRSTTNTNIYYHLGLVYYLRGSFDLAWETFAKCLAISPNDDMTVATVHWLYMSLRRAGKENDAQLTLVLKIGPNMQILENDAYFRLCRMYQGEMGPEAVLPVDQSDAIGIASTGYGVANWYWCNGRRDEAKALLERTAASPMWPAFGVIAAEADLVRLRE